LTLLERCKAGEGAAWRELFAQRAGQVYRWAVLLGHGPAEAEDVAQDALATAAARIQTCEEEEAMTTWLYQITRRVAANHRRKGSLRRRATGDHERAVLVQDSAADLAHEIAARRCLARLPLEQAEILVMHDIVGFTRSDCARILGVPEGTVASRLRRAQAAFRELWDDGAPSPRADLEDTP
jgi:RNA polymerase sigma-70 factor (ECF subfamily)